jgi:hypothetical protein
MFMRKYIISVCWFLIVGHSSLKAQLTLNIQVPPVGVMLKAQLWNMALLNAGGNTVYATIGLTLLDASTNQPVLQGATRPILLNKGLNIINARNTGPIQYTYNALASATDRDPNGFLTVGNYRACYKVTIGENTLAAEDCLPVEVQPLSPPQLNLPADTATLQTPYPQFTWLPPLPLNLFSDLSYDLLVVEVMPGQNPNDAIQKNIPAYNINNYKSLVNNYPASYKALDTGRIYAWRILAMNAGQYIAQSEVWTFHLATVAPPPTLSVNGNYILLKKNNETGTGIYNLPDIGAIGIKYYSFEKDHPATLTILNADGANLWSIQQTIVYGDNYLVYPLSKSYEKNKVYRVELTDMQGNSYTARFTINK